MLHIFRVVTHWMDCCCFVDSAEVITSDSQLVIWPATELLLLMIFRLVAITHSVNNILITQIITAAVDVIWHLVVLFLLLLPCHS